MVCSVTNIVLDFIFIAVMDMGVTGAAIATCIARALSAILILRKMMRLNDKYNLRICLLMNGRHLVKELKVMDIMQ